jgi:Rap1a immunity proteins
MKLFARLLLILLIATWPIGVTIPQQSEPRAIVSQGFVTTEQYLDLGKEEQSVYAAGLMDGINLAPMFDAPNNNKYLVSLKACMKDMTNIQVAAIITKYAKDHPERWHLGTNIVAYQALRDVCPVP